MMHCKKNARHVRDGLARFPGGVMTRTDRHETPEPWWRGAVIYQIYPRSFQDSDGDGVGDLAGIVGRLDHVARLGADAIWICPFFPSPMRDFGYDVSDYCGVDPLFGTLEDFDTLVSHAHDLGIKVLIDQVYSHCSDRHPWFQESRISRDNARADWFVWADAKPEGSPPNNWQSVFGGPAWTWDARRRQYYLHNFLKEQPQLNLHNPQVQEALMGVARFWLERGVDGFRIDALNFALFDPALADNPPAPPAKTPPGRPFDFQLRLYNQFHPATLGFLERLRGVLDEYGATFSLGEIGGDEDGSMMKRYTAGTGRLNSAYGFDFLYLDRLTPEAVAGAMRNWPGAEGEGWPSWAFENHDAPRALSRWSAPDTADAFARMKLALLLCLRGNPILYQGEELGLEQDDIPFHLLQDPEAIANWPLTLSRDGARTPLPWDASPAGGFTSGTPWLPLGSANRARNAEAQAKEPQSLLQLTRQLIALRRAHAPLRHGNFRLIHAGEQLLVFERESANAVVTCAFNLGTKPLELQSCDKPQGEEILAINGAECGRLPPLAVRIVRSG